MSKQWLGGLIFGVCALGMSAAPAFAKEKEPPEARFKKMDTNNDGKVSLDEFKAHKKDEQKAEKHFKKMDTNGDGFLSLEEFKVGIEKKEAAEKKRKDKA